MPCRGTPTNGVPMPYASLVFTSVVPPGSMSLVMLWMLSIATAVPPMGLVAPPDANACVHVCARPSTVVYFAVTVHPVPAPRMTFTPRRGNG